MTVKKNETGGYYYNAVRKDLPSDQIHHLFVLAGWSDGSESPEMVKNFNVPFVNSTLVISVWEGYRLIGVVRALSDKMFRSVIYDLVVDPEFQGRGIGSELINRCISHYPNSEWSVMTKDNIAGFYEKLGFKRPGKDDTILNIPCKLFSENVPAQIIPVTNLPEGGSEYMPAKFVG